MASNVVVPRSLRVGEVLALTLGFGLSTLAVCARIYTKLRLMRNMKPEDYLSVVAWLAFIGYIGLGIAVGENDGDAMHTAYLSGVESLLYCPIIFIVKLSILLQYLTIFVPQRLSIFRCATHFLIWTNALYYTISTFLYIFECTPRAKLWDPSIPGHCFSEHQMGVASGSLNVLSDFSILILPLPTIWRLQMSKKNKLAVTAVFAIGFFASVTSILRLVYSIDLLRLAADTAASQTDIDTTGLWSIAEIAVGIIVGCLPVLPRFFRHFVPKRSPPLSDSETLLNSSSGRSFWRKLFRKSAALDASNEKIRVAFQSVSSGTKTKATPPQISTMNFTSHSLHMAGNDLTRPPSPRSGSGTDIDLEGQYSSQANHEAGKTKQHPKEKMNVEDEGDGGAGY